MQVVHSEAHLCVGVGGRGAVAGVRCGSTVARVRSSPRRGAVRLCVASGSAVAAVRGLLHKSAHCLDFKGKWKT